MSSGTTSGDSPARHARRPWLAAGCAATARLLGLYGLLLAGAALLLALIAPMLIAGALIARVLTRQSAAVAFSASHARRARDHPTAGRRPGRDRAGGRVRARAAGRAAPHRAAAALPAAGHPEPGLADQAGGGRLERSAHGRPGTAAAQHVPSPGPVLAAAQLAAHRPSHRAGSALDHAEHVAGLDTAAAAGRTDGAGADRLPGTGGRVRGAAARVPGEQLAGAGRARCLVHRDRAGVGPVAAARLRAGRPGRCWPRPGRPSWPSGCSTWPRPGPRPSTPGRPRCAGSSGTCTTARRPGWSRWA